MLIYNKHFKVFNIIVKVMRFQIWEIKSKPEWTSQFVSSIKLLYNIV